MVASSSPSNPSWNPQAPMVTRQGITLETFTMEGMIGSPGATGAFTSLLNQIGLAARLITARVRHAGLLADVLGATGQTNVQGEAVQRLDTIANDTLCTILAQRGHCAAIVSEELGEIRLLSDDPRAKYIVLVDPLDGSSNIDCNVAIGTIFAILRKRGDGGLPASEADVLRPGRDILCAGYLLYSSATTLVITTGKGVHEFTYDPEIGEFFLSQENIRIPARGAIYSVNEGNSAYWDEPVRRWTSWIKQEDKETGRPYTQRYVGSMVADAHRTLVKGGIFAYPADRKSPQGKLRLLYEANPFSYIFEAAGGTAIVGSGSGNERILDIEPASLHQRTPLVLGSPVDVENYRKFMRGEQPLARASRRAR